MKKLCLFDLDGTLTDSEEGITGSIRYALESLGIDEPDYSVLKSFIGPPLRDTFGNYYRLADAEVEHAIEQYREYFFKEGMCKTRLYDGAVEALHTLRNAGVVLAIATSKAEPLAKIIAEHFGIASFFEAVVGCESDGSGASKAEIIKAALERVDESRTMLPVMIGDRKFDISGANQVGITSIGVTWGFGSRAELEKEKPTFMVDSYDELCSVLLDRVRAFVK